MALRNHPALICMLVYIARSEGAPLGGMPRRVQDRVRERQEGFLVANQCRSVCNDRPLVAASILVLSLVVDEVDPAPRAVPVQPGGAGWFTEGFDTGD